MKILRALTTCRFCGSCYSGIAIQSCFPSSRGIPAEQRKQVRALYNTVNNTHPSEKGEALSIGGNNQIVPKITQAIVAEKILPRWFAVYTTPRHEKCIAEHFGQRQIENYLPLYRAHRRWKDGSRVNLELPLFPNYIFVRIAQNERVRVLEVPGVQGIIGSAHKPAPLPDFEIESLRADLHKRKFEPHPFLAVGDRARIRAGAMAGMEGIVVRKNNNLRVVLTLAQIMGSVAVEVESADIELIGLPTPRNTAKLNGMKENACPYESE